MNTEKSDAQVAAFNERTFRAQRQALTFEREIAHPVEAVFPLLCPSRESDWIPGWTAELVHTTSGYIEEDCVFRTDDTNGFGPGVWVCCRHEQDRRAEFVRLMDHLVFQLKITLTPGTDGATKVEWRILLTGLDDDGNQQLEALPDLEARFESAIDALVYYLDTGEIVPVTQSNQ
ncbi:MAG: hypothetical protein GY838_10630 [bacterium]|nr:hypothetical protein [bacterium]